MATENPPEPPPAGEDKKARNRRTNVKILKIIGVVVAVLIVIGIIGAAVGGGGDDSKKRSAQADVVGPKVMGHMTASVFITGDAEAQKNLKTGNVWCRWNGDEVEMGATLVNGMATHVTVHIQPNYRLKKAGLHGDGLGSVTDAGIDAGATREWTKKLGKPDNIGDTHPAITSCEPEVNGVDLG